MEFRLQTCMVKFRVWIEYLEGEMFDGSCGATANRLAAPRFLAVGGHRGGRAPAPLRQWRVGP